MTTPDNFLASSPIPVYALALPRSDVLIYAGGGGRSRSGVSNAIRSTTIKYEAHELVDRAQVKLSNEEDAPMCLTVAAGDAGEEPVTGVAEGEESGAAQDYSIGPSERKLVVGINSNLTQSGTNENLRLFEWTSGGYKPSAQTSTLEMATDMVKEQVKNDAPGENTRDEDVQDIKSLSQAQSIEIKDLEQYIKVTVLSPNRKFLAVGATDGQIALHSFPSLEKIWVTSPLAAASPSSSSTEEVIDITFSSDSSLVAFVMPTSIQIYSTSSTVASPSDAPEAYQTIRNPALKGTSGCVFRAAKFGRSGSRESGRSDRLFTVVNSNPAKGLGSSKKDREKARIRKCFVSTWDADKWTLLKTRQISDRPATVFALSENGKHLAISTSDMVIHLLSSSTLSTLWRLKDVHAFPSTCLAFSPKGDVLVSGSADMSLRVIKVGSAQEPAMLYDVIHSKAATLLLAFLLAILALYLQLRIAPSLPMENDVE